jgi:hypothetical protein
MQRIIQLCLVLLLSAPAFDAHAQGKLKYFDDCGTRFNSRFSFGDTIVIRCDSSVMMNKSNFAIFQTAYEQYRQRNPNTDKMLRLYETLAAQQDSTIQEGQRDYNALKLKFDTLYFTSLSSINKTSQDIGTVKENLGTVSNTLNNTQVLISDAIDKVNEARRKSFLSKLAWGVGGFGIGVGLAAILIGVN